MIVTISESLKKGCVIDTSLLSNFTFTGQLRLLEQLIGAPVFVPPSVIDPNEVLIEDFARHAPRSEFLKPLHELHGQGHERYASAAPFIRSFATSVGTLWQPVELSLAEMELAVKLRNRAIWNDTTGIELRFKKKGLGAGEAEVCAVGILRELTLLIDDQAAVELIQGLGYRIPCIRTCMLLQHAVGMGLLSCESAMKLFNEEIVDRYGFNAIRNRGGQRLWLRCNPPRCQWEDT